MANQETFVTNAAESTLSSSAAVGATTLNMTSTAAFPAVPFYATIDPSVDASREVVLATAKTATTLTVTRAQDGTSDVAHASGAVIAVVPVAALWTDINDRVDAKATDADVVKLAGAQTITGAKTFSVDPTLADGSSALSLTEGNAAYEPLKGTFRGAKAYLSANQSLANATLTAISWGAEEFDSDAFHDTATNPSRFTAPAGLAGKYLVTTGVMFGGNATGARIVRVRKNGTTELRGGDTTVEPVSAGGFSTIVQIATTVDLAVGDYVEVLAYQSSGGALDVAATYSAASIVFLGA